MARGQPAHDVLRALDNQTILQLLASGDIATRRYELDLLATEMLNRLARLDARLREALGEVEPLIEEAESAAGQAERAATRSEGAITRHLDTRLDPLADEREAAQEATAAAQDTRAAIERLHEPRERIRHVQRDLEPSRTEGAERASAEQEE